MIVATNRAELADARAKMSGTVAVVMTMGALHDGHEALIRTARERADEVLVTIFVNPLQFGPNEDFDRYPRSLDADLAICGRNGVDVVFAPGPGDMYPHGEPAVRVNPGPVGEILEGASRPGFFHGVLTVVLKLLQLTRPHLAFFGEKDYQQLTLVRAMTRDLDVPVEIVGVPTVREADGLARSSRNRYLDAEQRQQAVALSRALREAQVQAAYGAEAAREAALKVLGDEPGVRLDYLALTRTNLSELPADPEPGSEGRILVAARVGTTRLIDNMPLQF